jgi:hypothetical protein
MFLNLKSGNQLSKYEQLLAYCVINLLHYIWTEII